ncbi:MAG: HNH endonuclease [Saprospiraceae bacterium]|nr:HNH endonuclease [Saprospiraceae bacterium]
MSTYVSERARRLVAERAGHRCEYCRIRQIDAFIGFEIDHTVAQKHGGGNEAGNLALACPQCNAHKGTDLTTFLESYQDIVPLFNPRLHRWSSHFTTEGGLILARTRIGQATIKLLQFNDPDRIIQRSMLAEAGCWPD